MNIIQAPINRNFTPGRQGFTPQGVVLHTYNGKGSNLQGWFDNPISQVSATASVLLNGDIIEYLNDMDTPWANGQWDANLRYLALEHMDNGDPQDGIRTPEMYESSAQWVASKYLKWHWDIENLGLIKPHYEFTSTGCPAALNFNLIRGRVYEILHPTPPPPEWKNKCIKINNTYTPEADFNLYDIDTNAIIKTFNAFTVITVDYKLEDWLLTQYSFDHNIKYGFKIDELSYKKPIPKPDIIKYFAGKYDETIEEFDYIEDAVELFNKLKDEIDEGEEIGLWESNKTQNTITLLEHFDKPIIIKPEPTEPEKPNNIIISFINLIINFFKNIWKP